MRSVVIAVLVILSIPIHIAAQQSEREDRIREHTERIRQIIEQSQKRRAQMTTSSAAAISKPAAAQPDFNSVVPDVNKEVIQKNNWAKLRDYYFIPDVEPKSYKGIQQEHIDDALEMQWKFGPDSVQLQYLWHGSSTTTEPVNASLYAGKYLLLRNGEECATVHGDPSDGSLEVHRWQQKLDINVTGRLKMMNPHAPSVSMVVPTPRILVTEGFPQHVNNWEFSVTTGTVLTLNAYDKRNQRTMAVGQRDGDYRPLDDMFIRIIAVDLERMAFLFEVERGGPQSSVFAYITSEKFVETAASLTTQTLLSNALENLGQHFGFEVNYADANAQEMAKQHFFKPPPAYETASTVLAELEKSLYPEFYPEVSTPDVITVRVAAQFLADHKEKPQLLKTFNSQYTYTVKTYTVEKISAATAQKLFLQKLGSYVLLPNQYIPQGSQPLESLHGNYYSVIKWPSDRPLPSYAQVISTDMESAIADDEFHAVVVNATSQTHDELSKLVDAIGGTSAAKGSTTGSSLTP